MLKNFLEINTNQRTDKMTNDTQSVSHAINKLIQKQDLLEDESLDAMNQIMSGKATNAQIACFLTALRMKGETANEIYACAKAMKNHASKISVYSEAVDTCGTGGDSSGTFNISTTAAFVVAGAGATVAKHGNRSVSSSSGSADLLEELGVNLNLTPQQVEECINLTGIGFLFAPTFHTAMKHVVPVRKELGIRTIFNILGPLTNPANVKRQVVGVYDEKLTELLAKALQKLGSEHALVVNGNGLDELSTIESTKITELKDGEIITYSLDCQDLGISKSTLLDLKGKNPKENAKITHSILNNEKSPCYDIVILNAGAALYVSGIAESIDTGVELAKKSIENGKAKEKLHALIEFTQDLKSRNI